jgi:adenylate cyclase
MERLNIIMQAQADIVLEYGGDVDKYVGDEMFAVFEGDDMVIRAVKAAEDIRAAIKKMNSSEEKPLNLGIGINTGDMISGNMGSIDRIDRTVIGDAVNLGARLCSRAGANTIIISEYSYEYVKDAVIVKEHDPIHVKGKEKAVKIYTLRKTI